MIKSEFLELKKIFEKICKNLLTIKELFARIILAAERAANALERYRSGHNEAVLKTVCPQGRVGSNPTLSVWSGCWDKEADISLRRN